MSGAVRDGAWITTSAPRSRRERRNDEHLFGTRTNGGALQRRFADRVGVPPRLLRSIFRFRRVFDHAARPQSVVESWLAAGLEAGYFDQPQMARDFRRFLGCTATEWAREQHELARAIASQERSDVANLQALERRQS